MRVACLLLSCAVALSRAGVVVDDSGSPILWDHSTGVVADLPVTPEGVYTPDPWHYLQRMGFYRLIIEHTNAYMTSMGPGVNQSPIWGLPLQLGWMLTSGRLAEPSGEAGACGVQSGDTANMCISPNSWWSCVNYFTSVLPFLSAAANGMLGDRVPVLLTSAVVGADAYCTTYETCLALYPQAMNNWDTFFKGLKEAVSSPLPDNEKKDALLGLYWNAAQASTLAASSFCNDRINSYSSVEKAFADYWLNAGEYVAACYFHSHLELATKFMTPLPGRILKDDDSPPNIADMTAEENRSLNIFSWMKSIEGLVGGSLVNLWRNSMCSVARRETGREMLENLMLNPNYATSSFISLVTTMATSCS